MSLHIRLAVAFSPLLTWGAIYLASRLRGVSPIRFTPWIGIVGLILFNYCDLTSNTMGAVKAEGALDILRFFLRETRIKFDRPIVFLVDPVELDRDVIGRVMQTLTEYSPEPKTVFEVPHFESDSSDAATLAYL